MEEITGDPGWLEVHSELAPLHVRKAQDYGTSEDALANYVDTSLAVGEVDEYTCWMRIHEKTIRALNLIRSGRADVNKEGVDVAALAIGAEALRRRRLTCKECGKDLILDRGYMICPLHSTRRGGS